MSNRKKLASDTDSEAITEISIDFNSKGLLRKKINIGILTKILEALGSSDGIKRRYGRITVVKTPYRRIKVPHLEQQGKSLFRMGSTDISPFFCTKASRLLQHRRKLRNSSFKSYHLYLLHFFYKFILITPSVRVIWNLNGPFSALFGVPRLASIKGYYYP